MARKGFFMMSESAPQGDDDDGRHLGGASRRVSRMARSRRPDPSAVRANHARRNRKNEPEAAAFVIEWFCWCVVCGSYALFVAHAENSRACAVDGPFRALGDDRAR